MIKALLKVLLALILLLPLQPALAAPVEWIEVPATAEGQQWWDRGSLRVNRRDELTVLSRFTPATGEDGESRASRLYVMAIDCGTGRFRDLQINGLPRLKPEWEIAADDALIGSVINEVCSAARERGLA